MTSSHFWPRAARVAVEECVFFRAPLPQLITFWTLTNPRGGCQENCVRAVSMHQPCCLVCRRQCHIGSWLLLQKGAGHQVHDGDDTSTRWRRTSRSGGLRSSNVWAPTDRCNAMPIPSTKTAARCVTPSSAMSLFRRDDHLIMLYREWGADSTLGFRHLIRCGRPPLGQGHPWAMMTASIMEQEQHTAR